MSTTTITCTACGGANSPEDTFCGSCSAFLEWDGAPAQEQPVPVGAAVRTAVGDASDPDPEHRLPQTEARRPAPRRAAGEGPTDLFCGSCGAGNALGRSFCRRCGEALADPEEPERPGWFQRWVRPLWPFGRREDVRTAGERPRSWARNAARQDRRRGLRWPSKLSVGKLAIPLMVLSLFGLGISPLRAKATTWAFETYDSIRRTVAPELVEITPAGAVADSETPDHPAAASIDLNTSSYWSEGREGPGIGATLTVSFASPTDLTQIGLINGATETEFAKQPRLRTVQVDLVDVAGESTTSRLELADTAKFRTYALTGTAVSSADHHGRGRVPRSGRRGRVGDRAVVPHEPVREVTTMTATTTPARPVRTRPGPSGRSPS